MLERYYAYAPDRTKHPYIFSPYSQYRSLINQEFEHGMLDCGYNILLKEKEYPSEFYVNYKKIICELESIFNKDKIMYVTPDYPCERDVLGFSESIHERIEKTIKNTLEFVDEKPETNWLIPLQGYNKEDYVYCIERYIEEEIPLNQVGVGTVCKRKEKTSIYAVLKTIRDRLPNAWIHAFGLTKAYLEDVIFFINSFDTASYTWGRFKYLPMDKSQRPERWNYPDFLFQEWKIGVDKIIETYKNQTRLTGFDFCL